MQTEQVTSTPLTYQTAKRFGRPTTLTPELASAIISLASEGHYIETCCAAVGVWERTYRNWLDRGKQHLEDGLITPESEFLQALKGAEAWGEIELIRDGKTGRMGWQGPITVASRRYRQHWQEKLDENQGPKVVIMVGGQTPHVQVNIGLSPPQISESGRNLAETLTILPEYDNVPYGNQPQSQVSGLPVKQIEGTARAKVNTARKTRKARRAKAQRAPVQAPAFDRGAPGVPASALAGQGETLQQRVSGEPVAGAAAEKGLLPNGVARTFGRKRDAASTTG